MSTTTKTTFTAKHLETLRREFSNIERIDPSAPTYGKLIILLDSLDRTQLKQIAGAGIKFVSMLAANRVRR